MTGPALTIGAAMGAGVWLVAWALRPAPRPLTDVIAGLPPAVRGSTSGTVAGWLLRAGARVRASRADLAVTGRSTEELLVAKLRFAVMAATLPFAGVVVARLLGWDVPVGVAVLPAAALAAVGWVAPDLEVRATAVERRGEFAEGFAAYLDLVAILLAGGAGPETACYAAATSGRGWAFDALLAALERAQLHGLSPWQALSELAGDLQVPELQTFADATGLAGRQGAKVRQTLTARAEAMRARRSQTANAAAKRATERMTLPLAGLGLAFLAWLLYPALVAVLGI